MKILHGEDQISTRRQLQALKKADKTAGNQSLEFDGQNLTLSNLINAAGTNSLLGGETTIYIDQLFARRPGKEKDHLVDYLLSHLDLPIVIWESKDYSLQLKKFPNQVIFKFDLPKYLYQFTDTLSLSSLQKALTIAAPEQIMVLLVRQIHNLIMVKSGLTHLPAWQISKLRPLCIKITLEHLIDSYRQLLEIDYRQKTSTGVLDLAGNLQLWLLRFHRSGEKGII